MPQEKTLSVIVPVFSCDAYLAEMLEKLFLSGLRLNAGRLLEIIIVDDASPLEKETAAQARKAGEWAKVSYCRNQKNLGYVRSVNRGLSMAGGELLLICNSDTRLSPGSLDAMCRALDLDPSVGIVGPVSNGAFNSAIQQAGGCPEPVRSFSAAELERFDAFGGRLAARGTLPFEAGWLLGFCTLMRREVYARLGPLDEGFGYGYLEEIDYAIRARLAGWKLAVAPDAFVFHGGLRRGLQPTGNNAGSQTARLFPVRTLLRLFRGGFYLARKHGWRSVGIPQDAAGAAARGF
ncbi:MAG: glycosyltransferase family 2 protein [Elusimicrobiota bacterium]|nr:glycosyltransferase family 2 protein [Elusimicrobiota bacterium]